MFVEANGIRLNVTDTGHGEPIVFLHGGGMHGGMWRPEIGHFAAAGYRCLAWDARGCGDSDTSSGPFTYRMFGRDLEDLLDHLDIAAVHLVGLSMGGIIAQRFAGDHPERVTSLALLCTIARVTDVPTTTVDTLADAATTADEDPRRAAVRGALAPATVRERPELVDELHAMHLRADPDGAGKILAEFRGLDRTDHVRRITSPTVVLCGKHDTAYTPLAAAGHIAATIPNATVHVVPDAAHCANLENPERVNDILAQHIGAAVAA